MLGGPTGGGKKGKAAAKQQPVANFETREAEIVKIQSDWSNEKD